MERAGEQTISRTEVQIGDLEEDLLQEGLTSLCEEDQISMEALVGAEEGELKTEVVQISTL